MNEEQPYINFDEYIRAREPHKRERAEAWRVAKGIGQDHGFLGKFFRNLLMGDNHVLKNRYMLVNASAEWTREVNTEQVPNKLGNSVHIENTDIARMNC